LLDVSGGGADRCPVHPCTRVRCTVCVRLGCIQLRPCLILHDKPNFVIALLVCLNLVVSHFSLSALMHIVCQPSLCSQLRKKAPKHAASDGKALLATLKDDDAAYQVHMGDVHTYEDNINAGGKRTYTPRGEGSHMPETTVQVVHTVHTLLFACSFAITQYKFGCHVQCRW
jgi:hypothetical protein